MLNHAELLEKLGQAELSYVSMLFWRSIVDSCVLPKNIHDYPDHPVWTHLNIFQNGWLECKNDNLCHGGVISE